jgi:hypothetical protein
MPLAFDRGVPLRNRLRAIEAIRTSAVLQEPNAFIELGLIPELDLWVVHQAHLHTLSLRAVVKTALVRGGESVKD